MVPTPSSPPPWGLRERADQGPLAARGERLSWQHWLSLLASSLPTTPTGLQLADHPHCQAEGDPTHLGLFLLCGVYDGGAANLCQLAALTVERPTADLVANDILDEEHAAVEAQGELVKQLDVFQQVVIRVAEKPGRAGRPESEVSARGRGSEHCWACWALPMLPSSRNEPRQGVRGQEEEGSQGTLWI